MADSKNTPELVSMAQQFTGSSMGSLIGGPLMAASSANQQMALSQVNFMMTSCFNSDEKGKGYPPVMIDMEVTRNVITPATKEGDTPTISNITSVISVPMLTLMPLNSLAVDSVNVSFNMEVKSAYSEDKSSDISDTLKSDSSFEGKIGRFLWNVDIKGSVSNDKSMGSSSKSHYEKSNSATYNVSVHASQLPLPPGVNIIIQALADNISPITMPTPKASVE